MWPMVELNCRPWNAGLSGQRLGLSSRGSLKMTQEQCALGEEMIQGLR